MSGQPRGECHFTLLKCDVERWTGFRREHPHFIVLNHRSAQIGDSSGDDAARRPEALACPASVGTTTPLFGALG